MLTTTSLAPAGGLKKFPLPIKEKSLFLK